MHPGAGDQKGYPHGSTVRNQLASASGFSNHADTGRYYADDGQAADRVRHQARADTLQAQRSYCLFAAIVAAGRLLV